MDDPVQAQVGVGGWLKQTLQLTSLFSMRLPLPGGLSPLPPPAQRDSWLHHVTSDLVRGA